MWEMLDRGCVHILVILCYMNSRPQQQRQCIPVLPYNHILIRIYASVLSACTFHTEIVLDPTIFPKGERSILLNRHTHMSTMQAHAIRYALQSSVDISSAIVQEPALSLPQERADPNKSSMWDVHCFCR
jgi:hypothetical protein